MGTDSGGVTQPYGDLIALAEREGDLIAARDYDELWSLLEARQRLMAKLPEVAPQDALTAIRRLLDLQRRNDELLERMAKTLEVELGRLRSGRAGVRKYAPGKEEPRLDFSA
jgi:hypothetical protein